MQERKMDKARYMSSESLGSALRAARKSQKLTQAELALAAGVGLRFLGELENGKPTAQIGKILQVVAAIGGRLELDWKLANNDRA